MNRGKSLYIEIREPRYRSIGLIKHAVDGIIALVLGHKFFHKLHRFHVVVILRYFNQSENELVYLLIVIFTNGSDANLLME